MRIAAVLVCLVLLAVAACGRVAASRQVPAADDEARIRQTLAIPTAAGRVSLTAFPASSGTFGREGLRIHAVFRFPADGAAAYASAHRPADWRALPGAAGLTALPGGVTDLPLDAAQGSYLCDVSVWQPGPPESFKTTAFKSVPPGAFHYWLAIVDPATELLHVLYKQNY